MKESVMSAELLRISNNRTLQTAKELEKIALEDGTS